MDTSVSDASGPPRSCEVMLAHRQMGTVADTAQADVPTQLRVLPLQMPVPEMPPTQEDTMVKLPGSAVSSSGCKLASSRKVLCCPGWHSNSGTDTSLLFLPK